MMTNHRAKCRARLAGRSLNAILYALAIPLYGADMRDHRAFTESFEGRTATPYKDIGGYSIGVGHHIPYGKPVPRFWTNKQIDSIFAADMSNAVKLAREVFQDWDSLPYQAQLVTADLAFNMAKKVKTFKKAITACNRRDWQTMANELQDSKWYRQTGKRGRNHVAMIKGLDKKATK